MRIQIGVVALGAAMFAVVPACKKKPAEKKPPGDDPAAGPRVGGDGKIAIPARGITLDPAVKKRLIPNGAWYCDKGTVHFARMQMGDRTCPECLLPLKRMGGPAPPGQPGPGGPGRVNPPHGQPGHVCGPPQPVNPPHGQPGHVHGGGSQPVNPPHGQPGHVHGGGSQPVNPPHGQPGHVH